MNPKPRVALVGGGLGGLTALLALTHVGIEAHVFEQASELKEIGAGSPAHKTIVNRRRRTVFGRAIAPSATALDHMQDAADDATIRGTGAGSSELQQILGVWTNKVAITDGPRANKGTFVGTIRSNGSS